MKRVCATFPTNGDLKSLLLFGGIAALGILGTIHIERRRKRDYPESWQRFSGTTLVIPFLALLQGRTSVTLAEIGYWRIALGLGIYAASLFTHVRVIGESPFPYEWLG